MSTDTPAGPTTTPREPLQIRPLCAADDVEACAALMAGSDPWLRLGVDMTSCRRILAQPERECWAAWQDGRLVGFAVLNFKGPFVGYLQLLGVASQARNQGIGAALLAHAEQCIFARTANVFICVSSFNEDAQRFYARQGYTVCGRLTDFLVAGHDELLLRKTSGPLLGR